MENTATTTISFRLNKDTKRQAEELFQSLGMNMSVALNLFLTQAVRYRGIPFEVRIPNEETLEAMQEAERIARDPNAKRYQSFSALMEDITHGEI